MGRTSFFMRRKLLILLLATGVIIYLSLWDFPGWSLIFPDRPIPEYILTKDYSPRIYRHRLPLYQPENISSTHNTFVYIPTDFNENEAYILNLLRHNGYVAAVLSEEYSTEELISVPSFFCTCGRVSDPCICCGILQPQLSDQNRLSPDLYQPILLTNGSTKAAQLCVNTTYLPNKKQIKTSAIFVNLTSSQGNFKEDLDLVIKKSDKIVMEFQYLSTLFNTVFVPSSPLPVICSGHSKSNYIIDLCVNFTTLEYKFDSDSDHKTVFHGCAFIQIVLNKIFVVARYPMFCFDAYRGAAGDADQASKNKKPTVNVLTNPPNPSTNYFPIIGESTTVSYVISSNYSNSSSIKPLGPSFQIVNSRNKDPEAPLRNSHELHLGVP